MERARAPEIRTHPNKRTSSVPSHSSLVAFSLIAFGLVLTPGPNMIYLISRSICQGRMAGLISLGGVALGFVFYMLCAAFGITAIVLAVPFAYDALRFGGRSICSISPGRPCAPADGRRSRCAACRRTARANCSPWAS